MNQSFKDYFFAVLAFVTFVLVIILGGEQFISTSQPAPLAGVVCLATLLSWGISKKKIVNWKLFRLLSYTFLGLSLLIQIYLLIEVLSYHDWLEARAIVTLVFFICTAVGGYINHKKTVDSKRFECEELN